jgi:hypothetical protein
MTKNRLFFTPAYQEIERKTLELLNSQQAFLSPATLQSVRAAGDAIETIIADSFGDILGEWRSEYSANFARRAMADVAFTDVDGFYYVVDVKTHRADTKFNMPNLTSVERLSRFYEDDANYFVLLLVSYQLMEDRVLFTDVKFTPIEFLSWNCLTIGALGWGQIQIANSNQVEIQPQYSRKNWMLELCDALTTFYPKEIEKITARIQHFEKVRQFWLAKPDA